MNVRKLFRSVPVVLGIAVGGLALVACGSTSTNLPAQTVIQVQPAAQVLSYQIHGAGSGKAGPDGATHDVFASLSSTTVKVGQPVTITVDNTDDTQHSFTSPDLGLNIVVPGKTATADGTVSYTFTPTKAGTFRWFCALPCDTDNAGWDMTADSTGNDQLGFMAGTITVTQ
ncbi:MAG TPA: cupredoxin domain-containing protein [Candidatus Dormibacteraeota bacterium]|nr:cupredoxin domain-containing protein [Candidatus Dormibacteraeota bacterium]